MRPPFLALFTLCFAILPSFAVEPPTPTLLTWHDSVREAEGSNPELGAEKASLAQAEAELGVARSAFFPSLTGRMSVTRANTPTSLNILGQTTGRSVTNQYENSLTASQNLFNGFRDTASYRLSRTQRDSARWQVELVRARISAELKRAFAQLLFAQEQVTLTEAITERRAVNTRSVRLRYEAGRENKGSFLRTSADEAAARLDEAQAQRALRVAQREMARVLGRDTFAVVVATGTLVTPEPDATQDFGTLARQTPAAQRARLALEGAQAGIGIAEAGFLPSLNAQASGNRSGRDWPPESDRWSVGAALTIPFFSGGSTYYDRQAAVQEKRRARFTLSATEGQTAQDLEETFAALQDAVSLVAVNQQYLEAAHVRADIARGQYANGLISYQDWDLIENELVLRQKARIQSLRDAQLAEAGWQNAQGQADAAWTQEAL